MIRRALSAARRLQRLPGEEHDGGFHDGEHQRQERRGDHAEFDGGCAVLLTDQPAHGGAANSRVMLVTSLARVFPPMFDTRTSGGTDAARFVLSNRHCRIVAANRHNGAGSR